MRVSVAVNKKSLSFSGPVFSYNVLRQVETLMKPFKDASHYCVVERGSNKKVEYSVGARSLSVTP